MLRHRLHQNLQRLSRQKPKGHNRNQTSFRLRAKATDTGGNFTWSDEVTVTLSPDITPPSLMYVTPRIAGVVVNQVQAVFNEEIDLASLTTSAIRLFKAGADGKLGRTDAQRFAKVGDVSMRNAHPADRLDSPFHSKRHHRLQIELGAEPPKPRAVDVSDRDDRYSFTTVTRTSGRTSGWILIPTWYSPSSRIGSGRSIFRLSTRMFSSSSLRWMSLAVTEP